MNFEHELRVQPEGFSLKQHDPAFHGDFDEPASRQLQAENLEKLLALQDRLYAEERQALLIVLQGLDAAGKDSTIKHVMSGVNPAGCDVHAFKQPSHRELRHDFLWRAALRLPEKGKIVLFNRSYYEETLVVRVHPELLEPQRLPAGTKPGRRLWTQRFKAINAFERHLSRNGTRVVKFFLHVSKEEQRRRFLARIENPSKNWKFSRGDVDERAAWDRYQRAYADMLKQTSTRFARWYVVPADNKWFAHAAVSTIVVDHLKQMDPRYPCLSDKDRRELDEARRLLEREGQ